LGLSCETFRCEANITIINYISSRFKNNQKDLKIKEKGMARNNKKKKYYSIQKLIILT
jgi:hypothetical protein